MRPLIYQRELFRLEEQILRDEQTIKRLQARIKENKAKESEKERKARTKRLIELGGFIEGQLSEESISILKVLPRFRFVKMDNYLKKIAVEAGGIENLRRLQVEKVDTQGNV